MDFQRLFRTEKTYLAKKCNKISKNLLHVFGQKMLLNY